MSVFDNAARAAVPDLQRAMGAYYTPGDASAWMAQWLLGDGVRTVLEPSSGDGAFVAALVRAAEPKGVDLLVHAVELDAAVLETIPERGVRKVHSDFHLVHPFPVDAAIGNPPFVRFRHLSDDAREVARRAGSAAMGGVRVDRSGSIWMTVVLHAATFLRPGGRLAFVLPADALYVRYAQPFWNFMAHRFGTLRVVRCRERIFPDIFQDVVVLLADRSGSSTHVIESELYATRFALTEGHEPERVTIAVADVLDGSRPFVKALLGEKFGSSLQSFEQRTVRADTYAKFNSGYVDASKAYFHPSAATQCTFDLPARSLRAAAKNARPMAGAGYSTSSLPPGATHSLWLPDVDNLTPGELRYIAAGEKVGVHTGFKTRNRRPWYRVPDVRVPDLLLPVFGELPKMMLNEAGLVASNSVLLGFWRQPVDPSTFILAWYSSPTRLGIELSVHSLGGGVLVVVPREADSIRMPRLPELPPRRELLDQLDEALRAKDLPSAYRVGDAYLLEAGWPEDELATARQMADVLRSWRVDR